MRAATLAVALGALAAGLAGGRLIASGDDGERTTVVRTRTVHAGRADLAPTPSPRVVEGGSEHALNEFVPPDADVLWSRTIPAAGGVPQQIAVTWRRRNATGDHGINLYQAGTRPANTYRRVFAIGDRPERDRHGFRASFGDVDGDGHSDMLIFEDLDGSAGNGIYHLVATIGGRTRELYRKRLSYDQGSVRFSEGVVLVYEGIVSRPGDHGPHCCWNVYRRTVKTWNGSALVTSRTSRLSKLPDDRQSRYEP